MLPIDNSSQMNLSSMLNLNDTPDSASPASANAFEGASMDPSSSTPLGGGQEQSSTQEMLIQVLQNLIQIITQLLESLSGGSEEGSEAGEESSAAPSAPAPSAPSPAPASGDSSAPAPSSQGASPSGDTAGSAKGKEMSFDGQELSIGEDWGGWDGVSAGELSSTHDVEDRNSMVGVLQDNWNMSEGEAEQVTTALHSAAKSAGLDADKGVHSDSQANQIKEQNHSNIKNIFESVGADASAEDFIASINEVYTGS